MSKSPSPGLSSLDLWGIHAARCIAVLQRALELMAASDLLPSPLDEVTLNRALYWHILAAQRELGEKGLAPLAPVIPEGHNPPAADDVERGSRENKIPDFQWGLTDDQVADIRRSAKHFVVECKCLIEPRRADWIYTEQYVIAGIKRFVSVDHGYGIDARDGAMVGYVRSLSFEELLSSVGEHVMAEGLPALGETSRDEETRIELAQDLDRPFGESPIRLAHFWHRV
ncbi:hypothetical protein [Baekduia sp. Peel2402]|uniref:hypothetical protein n=1 Tax=Baekduia sp. Peel2402 TaxID=3458296 RepID=UPI00403E55BF